MNSLPLILEPLFFIVVLKVVNEADFFFIDIEIGLCGFLDGLTVT